MPVLELSDRELIVHLGKWERIMAFHPDIRLPLTCVKSATKDCSLGGASGMKLGWRVPGTHIPFVVAAGTFIRHGERQFVFTRRKLQTVVIELAHKEWTRLVIGVPDADAEAARINAAVAHLHGSTRA